MIIPVTPMEGIRPLILIDLVVVIVTHPTNTIMIVTVAMMLGMMMRRSILWSTEEVGFDPSKIHSSDNGSDLFGWEGMAWKARSWGSSVQIGQCYLFFGD